jgi:hypothetical protein
MLLLAKKLGTSYAYRQGVTMAIEEYVAAKRAEIKRLEDGQRFNTLGEAAVAGAEEKGVSETFRGRNNWGHEVDCVQTPFVHVSKLGSEVAVRRVGTNYIACLVKLDDSNNSMYARQGGSSCGIEKGKIVYATPPDNLATADTQLVEAISEVAGEMGVDITDPQFEPDPVRIGEGTAF